MVRKWISVAGICNSLEGGGCSRLGVKVIPKPSASCNPCNLLLMQTASHCITDELLLGCTHHRYCLPLFIFPSSTAQVRPVLLHNNTLLLFRLSRQLLCMWNTVGCSWFLVDLNRVWLHSLLIVTSQLGDLELKIRNRNFCAGRGEVTFLRWVWILQVCTFA